MKEMMSVRETNPDYRNIRRSLTNEQARDVMLAQAPNHKKIEKDAVVMYKDVVDPSDAYTRYVVVEDRDDRVLMADLDYYTALGPLHKVAMKSDLKLYRKKK